MSKVFSSRPMQHSIGRTILRGVDPAAAVSEEIQALARALDEKTGHIFEKRGSHGSRGTCPCLQADFGSPNSAGAASCWHDGIHDAPQGRAADRPHAAHQVDGFGVDVAQGDLASGQSALAGKSRQGGEHRRHVADPPPTMAMFTAGVWGSSTGYCSSVARTLTVFRFPSGRGATQPSISRPSTRRRLTPRHRPCGLRISMWYVTPRKRRVTV